MSKLGRRLINQSTITNESFQQSLSEVLQRKMRWVKNPATLLGMFYGWGDSKSKHVYQGNLAPTAADLLNMMATDDDVFERMMELTGRRTRPSEDQRRDILTILREGK